MEKLILSEIIKNVNTIQYRYEVSESLSHFFTDREFCIKYPENIESVPDSIAAIPFVCNVLPIIWLTDSKLVVPELDEAFYNCIPEVKNGYETMYPETKFLGEIEVTRVVPCDRLAAPGKCAMFYSCGVDSIDTLIRHLEEKPELISIWGSDIRYDNTEGWELLESAINEVSNRYSLSSAVIRSTFREFDREGVLSKTFSERLKDNWWHGVKHGIALLGHVAPLAYLHQLEKMYIASTHCPTDGRVRCASNPLIDNQIRYCGCFVIHDGFECSRQDKVKNIVSYCKRSSEYLPIHVCWETQTGDNCCKCEKCFRTIVGIIVEGGDPERFGFREFDDHFSQMRPVVISTRGDALISYWSKIQKSLIENKKKLRKGPYWERISWIEKADFTHPETLLPKPSINTRVRGFLSRFSFYKALHEWKVRKQ